MRVHDEQGISRTSVRDVAARAGVSPATVLNHFPRMLDLIRACGQLSDEQYPMPTTAVIGGARDVADAVRLAAAALFGWWEAMGPGWEHLQVDRRTLPDVDAWLRDVDCRHRGLIAAAARVDSTDRRLPALVALTTYGAWRSLRASGLDTAGAAAEVERIFTASPREPASMRDLH